MLIGNYSMKQDKISRTMKRLLHIFFLLIFLISCVRANINSNRIEDNVCSSGDANLEEGVVEVPFCDNAYVWEEYKCFRPTSLNNEPYDSCFLMICDSVFLYFKYGKLIEKDIVFKINRYNFTVFQRKEKSDDIIQFLNEEADSVLLIRYNFDGEQEFFKRYYGKLPLFMEKVVLPSR